MVFHHHRRRRCRRHGSFRVSLQLLKLQKLCYVFYNCFNYYQQLRLTRPAAYQARCQFLQGFCDVCRVV